MTKPQRGAVVRTANAWDNFIVGTGTATVLGAALADSNRPILEIIIQNDPDSTEALFVGNPFSQPWQVAVGNYVVIPVCDLSLVYVRSAAGTAIYNYMAGV